MARMASLVRKLLVFIKKRMLVAYLTLIPSLLLTLFSLSYRSMVIFAFQLLMVLIGTYVMFRDYNEEKKLEKLSEENKFIEKLKVHLKNLKNEIGHANYDCSLLQLSMLISRDGSLQSRTTAWSRLFNYLIENFNLELDKLINKLDEEIEFSEVFINFQDLLSLLERIRIEFYDMIKEIKPLKDFSQDPFYQKKYSKLYDEYNRYMDKLGNLSDECESKFNLKLSKHLIEHLKEFDQL